VERGSRALRAALTVAVLVTGCRDQETAERHVPDAAVPRMHAAPVQLTSVQSVSDYVLRGSQLYVLDGMAAEVRLFDIAGEATETLRFGRRGAGPGEFQLPHGIARMGDDLLISDERVLHRFDSTGSFLGSMLMTPDCPLLRPRVFTAAERVFVAGNCRRLGTDTDTMVAVVYDVADSGSYSIVASDVLYTRDGSVGSFLNATLNAGDGSDGILFGGGSHECFLLIPAERSASPTRKCLPPVPYGSDPPEGFENRAAAERARRPALAASMRWPDNLPWYVGMVVVDGKALAVRQWSADSLVFQTVPEGVDILVTSWDGFVGCRSASCMWSSVSDDGMNVSLLMPDDVRTLLNRQVSR